MFGIVKYNLKKVQIKYSQSSELTNIGLMWKEQTNKKFRAFLLSFVKHSNAWVIFNRPIIDFGQTYEKAKVTKVRFDAKGVIFNLERDLGQ